MIELPTLYTVAQIARALGVDYKAARRLMLRAIRSPEVQKLRGQKVDHYSIPTFPPDVLASLRRIAQKRGYASIPHLLVDPPKRWQPEYPLERLAESAREEAALRQFALAPILKREDALILPTSELIRRAQVEFGRMVDVNPRQDLAVREWIERAKDRDRDWHEWDRVEIYLDEKPPLQKLKPAQHETGDEAVGFALIRAVRAALLPDTPTEQLLCNVWHAAFTRFSELVESNMKPGRARRLLIKGLEKPGLSLLPAKASARSHSWTRGYKKWQSGGRCPEAMADGRARNAREKAFELTTEEVRHLRYWRLLKGSLDLAVGFFYYSPICRPETRVNIEGYWDESARRRRPVNWPMSMRRAGKVTAEEEAKLRGEKAFKELQQVSHRGMWYPGPEGEKIPLSPNAIWESDDMSINEPFSYLDPETGEKILIGRQTLTTQDVYSAAWLSVMPVGRVRDAYRVEDLADFFRETVLANGLPDVWRLEGGVWENNMIDGIPLPDETRWGGLRALFHVERARGSRGKGGIEVGYNHAQSLLAHESLTIGRKRGEFVQATKMMLRAKAGDERAAGQFWTIPQCADGMMTAAREFNAEQKTRRAFGRDEVVPNELYRGAERKECPESELWRFCPIKKQATVRRESVEVSVPTYPRPFSFRVNGQVGGPYFAHGHAVLIAFHPGHPEWGCHVFNAETGARNRDNRKFAEFMVLAPFDVEQSQFGQSFSNGDPALAARKRASAAVAHEFRAIMATAAPRISVSRDGQGGSRRVEQGGGAPRTIGGDSIKAQRAEKRRKEADAYQQKAMSEEAAKAALAKHIQRREEAMVASGTAYRESDGTIKFL